MAGSRASGSCRAAAWFWSFTIGGAMSVAAGPALAATPADAATAQALFDQGRKLVSSGNEKEACPKFEESQRLDPGTGTEFNLADCYERAGRFASAWTLYLDVASQSRAVNQADREQLARGRAQALVARLSKLVIEVPEAHRVAGLSIVRSGASSAQVGGPQWGLPLPVDAGEQVVRAEAPGHEPWEGKVTVGVGATASIEVPELTASPPGASTPATPAGPESAAEGPHRTPPLRTVAYGLGAAGIVGVGVGSIFGLKAMSAKSSAGCNGRACEDDAAAAKYNDARSAGNVATIGFVAGTVLLGAGVVLYFVSDSRGASGPTVGLSGSVGPHLSSLAVTGAF